MAVAQAPDPLRLRPHGLDFVELKDLSEYLERIQEHADASLRYFRHEADGGFDHRVDPAEGPSKTSKASTATCLAYLRATGKLSGKDWADETREELRRNLIDGEWKSAGLDEDNPFTTSFLLEAIHCLGATTGLDGGRTEKVDSKIEMLNKALEKEGGLVIGEYPPTAFLTFKAVRVLRQWDRLEADVAKKVSKWIWGHLYEESMLIAADSPDADFFELAYSVLTASATSHLDRMTPRERRLLRHAIEQFFGGQRKDGTWPRSRPLFLYPRIGYAYCYDYELLVPLIAERQLRPYVAPHLEALRSAAWALDPRLVPLESDERAYGWSSEHHGKDSEPESWPTASVFHFCFELGRLVSDAIRRDVFEYVDAAYEDPKEHAPTGAALDELMDMEFEYDGATYSFKEVFEREFIEPLRRDRDLVRDGRSFPKDTKVSAIIYGPPGTSKTGLAKMIARTLGWPLLALDPSHLTRRGLDNVHAEADALFGRLRLSDQIVVLLDEFDELVREREVAGEFQSRFLTTAMLPKIAALHARRRLVYIVATNHLEQFDAAISRPGRFDVIVPLMVPTAAEKFKKWPRLEDARKRLEEAKLDDGLGEMIGDLTYSEAGELEAQLADVAEPEEIKSAVENAAARATVTLPVVDPSDSSGASQGQTGDETWKARLARESSKIRGLGL
jgi:hypothetical protein